MSERSRFGMVLVVCMILSVGWIIYAARTNQAATEAGRGGAVAVAISFLIMFLSRGYGAKAFLDRISSIAANEKFREVEGKKQPPGEEERIASLEGAVKAIVSAVQSSQNIADASTRRQSWFLAASSVIGTIAWGFGDLAATWLRGFMGW